MNDTSDDFNESENEKSTATVVSRPPCKTKHKNKKYDEKISDHYKWVKVILVKVTLVKVILVKACNLTHHWIWHGKLHIWPNIKMKKSYRS